MGTIAGIVASVATLIVALAALYLLVKIGRVVDAMSEQMGKPQGK